MAGEITMMLKSASGRGQPVSGELLPLVYDELRHLAAQRMSGESPGQTLQATALVHEAWLRLGGDEKRSWNDRAHFYRAAAQAMRRILVDRARAKASLKRGDGCEMIDIEGLDIIETTPDERVLLVDEVLERMEAEYPDSARLVTLKFFGGLTDRDIASMDGVGERTVRRHWAFAKVKLVQMIREVSS